MSTSRRRLPIFGITKAESEKKDKRQANRRHRRLTRLQVHTGEYEQIVRLRETSDIWLFEKDGKNYWRRAEPKDMRK